MSVIISKIIFTDTPDLLGGNNETTQQPGGATAAVGCAKKEKRKPSKPWKKEGLGGYGT